MGYQNIAWIKIMYFSVIGVMSLRENLYQVALLYFSYTLKNKLGTLGYTVGFYATPELHTQPYPETLKCVF